jgi:hypothetical protein
MKNVTTYVGIDAHKKDLFVAMLNGNEKTPRDLATGERTESRASAGAEARASARAGAGLL